MELATGETLGTGQLDLQVADEASRPRGNFGVQTVLWGTSTEHWGFLPIKIRISWKFMEFHEEY